MFGRVVDYGAVKYAMESRSGSPSRGISGGQSTTSGFVGSSIIPLKLMKFSLILCRSRTFMKSVVGDHENGDSGIGLLLFDEPSASLDPTAEHGKTL